MFVLVLVVAVAAGVVLAGDLVSHRTAAMAGGSTAVDTSRRRRRSWVFAALSLVTFFLGFVLAEQVTRWLGYDPVDEDLPRWVEQVGNAVFLLVALSAPVAGVITGRRAERLDHDDGAHRPVVVNTVIVIALASLAAWLAL